MRSPHGVAELQGLTGLEFALSFARIEAHYFVHGGFFREDGQLIKNAGLLKDIPGTIVQGRYDLVCPAKV